MSNALQTTALFAAIEQAVQTAWAIPALIGMPTTVIAPPYAVISATDVEVNFAGKVGTVLNPEQVNTFVITGIWPVPPDPSVQLSILSAEKANLLIAQLQTGPNFAGIAMFPLVTKISFGTESLENKQAVYYASLIFRCSTSASHH